MPFFENRPLFSQFSHIVMADSRCDTNNFIKHMNYIDNQDGKYSMSDLCHYFNILIVEDILSLILSLMNIFFIVFDCHTNLYFHLPKRCCIH